MKKQTPQELKILFREANLSDLIQLQKIGKQTFFETFSASNFQENINKYLEASFSLQKLT